MLNLLVILYVSDTQYSFAYNVIISHTVQLICLLYKNVISFCLNSIVEQYNIISKLGTFFYELPGII